MSVDWPSLVGHAVSRWETPFYLCAWVPIDHAIKQLKQLDALPIPIRHWLSFKTQPIRPLVRCWRDTGNGVEVVSEYEFLAAKAEGYSSNRIVVNGPAKHRWLRKHRPEGVHVHFDSAHEVTSLCDLIRELGWHVGLRLHVRGEVDPDERDFSGQFGMSCAEFCAAANLLRSSGVEIESVHFHLRSHVASPSTYGDALMDVIQACKKISLEPTYIDCGGGLPVAGERPYGSEHSAMPFDLAELAGVLQVAPKTFPRLREIWLENGRFLTSRSSVLVTKVADIKERPECRYLICDGGRTNHALVSDWERHDVFTYPQRSGRPVLTTVCGPTCMAFDRVIREQLPEDVQIGDFIVWQNAGAYHIPWETRFSGGLARVLWIGSDGVMSVAREAEDFKTWWSVWR